MNRQHPERLLNEQYLTLSSPFRMYKHEVDAPIAVHWHEFYELALVVSGEGTHVLNGTPHPIRRGLSFLLTPADFHELTPHPGDTVRLYNIIFSRQYLRDELYALLFDVPVAEFQHRFEDAEMPALVEACERLWTESNVPSYGSEFVIQGTLERLLIDLARRCRTAAAPVEGSRPQPGHPSIRKAIRYIENHFRDAISLGDVADYAGLSPGHFSESFRRHVGETFQTFLQRQRLRFAASLLGATDLPVTEICYASGFNTVTHFEKAFKARFGSAPRAFRQSGRTS
ncbi:AraC family transcriptional regulator [Paenibacillus sp.]|uniref:AraC family transcriptional regulator n=1 Tax=Paenibacillus sp. TaxID=58172 RepID=UPI002D65CBFF|nr:AraC family transcriptional regulator [Paenibacillus sp.]HZG56866.1 AraC family transcriptional regulator [Paenibacillus sp.]